MAGISPGQPVPPSDGIVVSQRRVGDRLVVQLAGELDLAAEAELGALLRRLTKEERGGTIVLDFSRVRLIDAHNIGLIINGWATAKAAGGRLYLEGLRGIPARLFEILKLTPLVTGVEAQAGQGVCADGPRRRVRGGRQPGAGVRGPRHPG